jgi:hypothetical protein
MKARELFLIRQCAYQLLHPNHFETGFNGKQCSNPYFTQVVIVYGIKHYRAHLAGVEYLSSIQHQNSDKLFVLNRFLTTSLAVKSAKSSFAITA